MTVEHAKTSRRAMLLGLGGGAVALGAVAVPAMTLNWEEGTATSESWWDRLFFSLKNGGHDEWSALVGSSFMLLADRGAIELKLAEVKLFDDSSLRPRGARDRAFAAIFETAAGAAAGDRIYSASHSRYGDLQIFMGPSYSNGRASRMEAIFN